MLLAIHFPSWLKPEIFPGLPIRWYGLMYIFAFGTAFLMYRRQVRERNFPITDDELSSLFFWGIAALIFGARVFYALVYDTSGIFRRAPWLIFYPFQNGVFTGLQGMSYHGGVIGAIIAIALCCKVKKFDFREIGDMFAASIPLGFTFGRLGNFINGELYGRITASPLGMYFSDGGIRPWDKDFDRIREAAENMGVTAIAEGGGILNFPRHPSQLYQMFFEGIFLWAIIWIFRNHKPFKGALITLYISGLGLFRFIIEYFRQPDADLGYVISFVKPSLPTAIAHPLLAFSMGQVLCVVMILIGLVWALFAYRMKNREPIFVYPEREVLSGTSGRQISQAEKDAERKQRRKLRRKLK